MIGCKLESVLMKLIYAANIVLQVKQRTNVGGSWLASCRSIAYYLFKIFFFLLYCCNLLSRIDGNSGPKFLGLCNAHHALHTNRGSKLPNNQNSTQTNKLKKKFDCLNKRMQLMSQYIDLRKIFSPLHFFLYPMTITNLNKLVIVIFFKKRQKLLTTTQNQIQFAILCGAAIKLSTVKF